MPHEDASRPPAYDDDDATFPAAAEASDSKSQPPPSYSSIPDQPLVDPSRGLDKLLISQDFNASRPRLFNSRHGPRFDILRTAMLSSRAEGNLDSLRQQLEITKNVRVNGFGAVYAQQCTRVRVHEGDVLLHHRFHIWDRNPSWMYCQFISEGVLEHMRKPCLHSSTVQLERNTVSKEVYCDLVNATGMFRPLKQSEEGKVPNVLGICKKCVLEYGFRCWKMESENEIVVMQMHVWQDLGRLEDPNDPKWVRSAVWDERALTDRRHAVKGDIRRRYMVEEEGSNGKDDMPSIREVIPNKKPRSFSLFGRRKSDKGESSKSADSDLGSNSAAKAAAAPTQNRRDSKTE